MTSPTTKPPGDSGLPIFRWALLAVALIILIIFGYCASKTIPAVAGFGSSKTTITHDLVVDRMRTVAKLVSSETTVRDVVIYQNTWLGSTKRTLVVVTGKLLAGINLEANPSVRIDSRTKRIAIELPPAELLGVEILDLKTYDESSGLWNPFTTADRDSVQRQVRDQLIKAGNETELLDHANRSAVQLLRTLLAQDGYTVDVTIRGQPKPSGVDK